MGDQDVSSGKNDIMKTEYFTILGHHRAILVLGDMNSLDTKLSQQDDSKL